MDHSNVVCFLEVHVDCHDCKMSMMEILSSVCGVYATSINAEKSIAQFVGEVDPGLFLRALGKTGRHGRILSVDFLHPLISSRSHFPSSYGGYGMGNGGGFNHYLNGYASNYASSYPVLGPTMYPMRGGYQTSSPYPDSPYPDYAFNYRPMPTYSRWPNYYG